MFNNLFAKLVPSVDSFKNALDCKPNLYKSCNAEAGSLASTNLPKEGAKYNCNRFCNPLPLITSGTYILDASISLADPTPSALSKPSLITFCDKKLSSATSARLS